MPILEHYRHYFDIDPEYFPAVNEALINSQPDLWKKFFPHETFIKLLKDTVSMLNRKQKLSLWVEGAYGTGKSHAVLTLKKLLGATDEETRAYFQKYKMDHDLCNTLQNIKHSGKILTVHCYGSSSIHSDNDLVIAIQESIERAFAVHGMENKASDSLKVAVIRYLSDPENKESFSVYVKGSYAGLFGGDDVDALIEKLHKYADAALRELMEKIFRVAKERQIRALTMTTRDLVDWIREVIKANALKAIVFIWDEFTEYFYNNSRHLTGFQEVCELSETDPFYFILVTHVSSGLFHERDNDFIKLNGRFVNPHSLISLPENIAFQLMGAAMQKNKDATVLEDWTGIVDDLADRTKEARKLVQGVARIEDKDLKEILPIHAYTALLLKHISSAFDSNQRSMFDFLKNDRGGEIRGFQWFIDHYGPEDDNPLLTIDMLWAFFYEKGKDFLAHDIRSVLDYFGRRSHPLDSDEKRVLKAVLMLQAISHHASDSVELFIPNEKNIDHAFDGSDLDSGAASRCAEKLVRDKVLFKRQLGGGMFQYNAYINEISGEELDRFKAEIDKKSTTSLITEQLADKTLVADAITLDGALKLRYVLQYVSAADFDSHIKRLRNQETAYENHIIGIVCFAKDDKESVVLGKKIRAALKDGSYPMVFIDATITPFGSDGYAQYRKQMAQSMYQQGKDNALAAQYANNAKDTLKQWRGRIMAGAFEVFTAAKPKGERVATLDALYTILAEINRAKFPDCLEAAYTVLPTMYTPSSLKLGVECGVNENTRQGFSSSNPGTKLEAALEGAWKEPAYWEKHPNLLISKIKNTVRDMLQDGFDNGGGRVSIRTIYDSLKGVPYGFMPCNLSAFILGFVLKEYVDGSYSWSDGLTTDVLDINKLKEMIDEILKLQITPNPRYKDKYIVAMTEDEKAFNEATSLAFSIPQNLCTAVENTRERIRNKMKDFSFPIWTLKFMLDGASVKTDTDLLRQLIDLYCGIANSHNMGSGKSDNDIALAIGALCRQHDGVAEDLKTLLTKENCTAGMEAYLKDFDGGALLALAQEVGDNGQYINVLRRKFDADAANWVWNVETAQQKIREVTLEYKIIVESNKINPKNISFENTVREWCDKCEYIRISYAAAKNDLDEMGAFLELLHAIKKAGMMLDSQKQKFLDMLTVYRANFCRFYDNQLDLFKRVCAFYVDEFNDEEIKELYQTIPAGTFTYEKADYLRTVETKTKEYKSSLSKQRLKKMWLDKTGTVSPREWAKQHKMPILCLIPDGEMQTARAAFDTINQSHSDAAAIEKAIEYLESAKFCALLEDNEALDKAFRTSMLKGYAIILTDLDEVKQYLDSRISAEPYDWLGLPETDKKLRQMAEAKYLESGCNKALEKIDQMNEVEVKRYLKALIKDNMIVGMEIIRGD